jgi:hypothetical protein
MNTLSFLFSTAIILTAAVSNAKEPVRNCAAPERWAPSMAQVQLKNAGLLKNEEYDFTKTKVTLLAMEKTKRDLFHQVMKVVFVKKNGLETTAITENDASNEECSISKVTVYVVEKTLGP